VTSPFTPAQRYADRLLAEWVRWCREDVIRCGWSHTTAFGRLIKPDPVPAREPIDDFRAERTDIVVAHLPRKQRYLVRVMYLDTRPITVKERKLRLTEHGYDKARRGLLNAVYLRLTLPP
jgi:hypothetical protein